jgi:hypothetical protein
VVVVVVVQLPPQQVPQAAPHTWVVLVLDRHLPPEQEILALVEVVYLVDQLAVLADRVQLLPVQHVLAALVVLSIIYLAAAVRLVVARLVVMVPRAQAMVARVVVAVDPVLR